MSHIGTGNWGAIVSTVAAVGFHGFSSFRYHKMNRIGFAVHYSMAVARIWLRNMCRR